jgi:hypothetical protein
MGETTIQPREFCEYLRALTDRSPEGGGRLRLRLKKRRRESDDAWVERKLAVLDAVIAADPAPDALRACLFEQALADPAHGVTRIVADDILMDWDLAVRSRRYLEWLQAQARQEAPAEAPVDFGGPRAAPPSVY